MKTIFKMKLPRESYCVGLHKIDEENIAAAYNIPYDNHYEVEFYIIQPSTKKYYKITDMPE